MTFSSYQEAARDGGPWPSEDVCVGDALDVVLGIRPFVFEAKVILADKNGFQCTCDSIGPTQFWYKYGRDVPPSSWWRKKVSVALNSPHTGKASILAPKGGVMCICCKLMNEDAGPNRPNGTYVCFNCRNW